MPTREKTMVVDGFTLSLDGKRLIEGCDVEECHVPYGVEVIDTLAFAYRQNIKRVYLPDTVVGINEDAFIGCDNVESIDLPNTITRIGQAAFQMCIRLKSISIPPLVVGLNDALFTHCFSLEEIVVPEGILAIGEYCFADCEQLRSIQLPASLRFIETNAFDDCHDLTIKVPHSSILDDFYNTHPFGDNCEFVRYKATYKGDWELDKKKCERFLAELRYKRERDDYESRKEMGLLTKEEIEREEAIYFDAIYDSGLDDF